MNWFFSGVCVMSCNWVMCCFVVFVRLVFGVVCCLLCNFCVFVWNVCWSIWRFFFSVLLRCLCNCWCNVWLVCVKFLLMICVECWVVLLSEYGVFGWSILVVVLVVFGCLLRLFLV